MRRAQPRRIDRAASGPRAAAPRGVVERHALDDLGLLRAVIEAGSFVRAGEALGLTASAVSRAVARLEARIGIRIFLRTARAIAMTGEGRQFYESIAPHLAAIEDATVAAAGAARAVRGRLRVQVDEGVGQYVLAPQLGAFLTKYPDLTVELAVRDRIGDLISDGFDIAVRFGQPVPSALRARLLLRTRILTCASPAYVAQHGIPRRPKDLEAHRCIHMRDPVTGAAFGWELIRGNERVEIHSSGQLFINGSGTFIAACLAGHGVAQLLELYARPMIDAGRLVQLLPAWADETYPLYAYHHAAQPLAAKVRAFLDFAVAITRPA